MTRADLHAMPGVERAIGRHGMQFTRALVSVSLCCPSRTSILRGQYAHNTGVETNGGTNGGFESAYRFGVEHSTIATWLHRAGYRTGLIGKYLNGFPNTAPESYRPPGWTEWITPVAGNPYNEYGYRLNVNGRFVDHGFTPADYGTTVYMRHARGFIARRRGAPAVLPGPLPVRAAPSGDARATGRGPLSRQPAAAPPSFDESDTRDKPRWLRTVPLMSPRVELRSQALFNRRRESLQAVDRGVVGLVRGCPPDPSAAQHLHRVHLRQRVSQRPAPAPGGQADRRSTRTSVCPSLVRGPDVAPGSTSGALVGNIDFAPTFARLAGVVRLPSSTGGRSPTGCTAGRRRRCATRS